MLKDYFLIAVRGITHRKIRSWLTMIGIFIGIAAVVALISLGEGMEAAVLSQFSFIGTDKLTIQGKGIGLGAPGVGVVRKLNDNDLETIRDVNGIEIATGRLLRSCKVEFKDELIFGFTSSIPKGQEDRQLVKEVLLGSGEMESGRFLKTSDKYKVVLGNDFANGELFKKPVENGDKITVQNQDFEVVGILSSRGSFIFDSGILMNHDVAEDLFDADDEYDIIAAKVSNEKEINQVAERIEKALRKEHNVDEGEEDFTVQTPQQSLEALTSILNIITTVLIGIAGISLLIGGIGIMNTMYTAVLQRTREIGIMKSVGGKNSDILKIFLIESGLLGLFGGVIGIGLGIGISKIVEIGAKVFFGPGIIQAHFSWILIGGSLAFAFLIGTLSGIFPAVQASRLKPVDALRYRK